MEYDLEIFVQDTDSFSVVFSKYLKREDNKAIFVTKDNFKLENIQIWIHSTSFRVVNPISQINLFKNMLKNIEVPFFQLTSLQNNDILLDRINLINKIYLIFCRLWFMDDNKYDNMNDQYIKKNIDMEKQLLQVNEGESCKKEKNVISFCDFPNMCIMNICKKIENINDTLKIQLINKIINIYFIKKFINKKTEDPSYYSIEIKDVLDYVSFRIEKITNNELFNNDILETFTNDLLPNLDNYVDSIVDNNLTMDKKMIIIKPNQD